MQQARLPFPPSRIYILVRNRFTFNTFEKGKQDISRPPSLQVIESNPEQVKLFGNSERKYAQTWRGGLVTTTIGSEIKENILSSVNC